MNRSLVTPTREILLAFSDSGSDRPVLGNMWRITAKGTDFYVDPIGEVGVFHLSVHGPNGEHPDGHRFHVKADRRGVAQANESGYFVSHALPRHGYPIDGEEIAEKAWRVARIRWRWDLRRPRYRDAARLPGPFPEITESRSGARFAKAMEPNDAADVDLVISYNRPYWPNEGNSLRNDARLGPLRNAAGMYLTATSYRRSQMKHPAPENLIPRLPRPDEEPNRILCAAPDGAKGNMYWFVEAITAREIIEASR